MKGNIRWIVAKIGRIISLLQANNPTKFHAHSCYYGEVILTETKSGK